MKVGDRGEDFAAKYLTRHKYTVIERNFRCRFGEIDIIARKDGFLVFVEVKTRIENAFVGGLESVDYHKQRRITAAANIYLKTNPTELQPRFDVISVEHDGGTFTIAEHIENAF